MTRLRRSKDAAKILQSGQKDKGQDASCTSDDAQLGFRQLGRFAAVAVDSGLRPETRNTLKNHQTTKFNKICGNRLHIHNQHDLIRT